MSSNDHFTHDHWESLLESIDLCIAQEAIMCHVRLLDPGVIERVLAGDAGVCGASNPLGFKKLKALLQMHFTARKEISDAQGEAPAAEIAAHVLDRLRQRIGDQLGGPVAAVQ